QDVAQFDDGLAQIGTVLRDGAFKGVDGFLRVGVGLFKIVQQRRDSRAGVVKMRDGRVQRLAILVEHATHRSQTGAQVRAVLVVQNVIHARNRGLQFNDALVEIVQQNPSLWGEVCEFRLQIAEAPIRTGFERGTRRRELRNLAAWNNAQKIVTERAVAADDDNAIRFYWNVRLHAKSNFHARGVMLVVTHVLDASHGRPTGITDFPARPQTTRIFEKCTVQNIAAIEKSGQREDGNDQKGGSDQDKESNDGFLAADRRGVHGRSDLS